MPIYVKYGSIKGEATAAKYKDWVQVDSFQWGVGRALSMPQGGGVSKRESSTPSVSEINITKQSDPTTVDFLKEVFGTKQDNKCNIDFTRTGTMGEEEPYLQYTLTDTAVSGYSISSGGDGRPGESLSLNFTKIETKYTAYDDKGSGKPSSVTYDLTTRSVS